MGVNVSDHAPSLAVTVCASRMIAPPPVSTSLAATRLARTGTPPTPTPAALRNPSAITVISDRLSDHNCPMVPAGRVIIGHELHPYPIVDRHPPPPPPPPPP